MEKKTFTLDEDIQAELTDLEIEAKRTRKKTTFYIFLIAATTLLLYLLYVNSGNALYALFTFIAVFIGALYIVFSAVPNLLQPLSKLDFAFKKIAEAIKLLKKSKSSTLALEEASNYVKNACLELTNVSLDDFEFYEDINGIFKKFVNNLRFLVPEIASGKINAEDLEKIAVALSSRNALKLEDAFSGLPLKVGKVEQLSVTKQLENFLSTHKNLANILFVVALVFGCIIFYYAVTVYVWIANNYAFAGSIALFVGILGIYFNLTKRK
jgi:hypothetical protein